MSRKAQITIFIILGMFLLMGAAFLYYIVSEVTITNLQVEQESSIAGMFQKEGLRLYVEDCIQDSLEEAIILVGEGGRIWYDTSAIEGTLAFSENNNGILYAGNYYYLGITNDLDEIYPNSYPCDENETNDPAFCEYIYLESGVFGHKESLTLSNIESDIEKYLTNATPACVAEFLMSNLSYSGDLGEGEVKLSVAIKSDGIDVDVEYPLELTVEGETYFHITQFDYFYPSELKTFLSKAVTKPLGLELSDIDFNWTTEELEDPSSDYYSSSYVSLSPVLTVTEVENSTIGMGHRVITYELEDDHILENQPYTFSFAIANRPPALDFIERQACTDYEYVVIPGSAEYGNIDHLVEAKDPDEDVIEFDAYFRDSSLNYYLNANPTETDYVFNITTDFPENFNLPDIYYLTINATDTHLESDWQDVRVLVDMPIDLSIEIKNAYADVYPELNSTNTDGIPLLSVEDPFFINLNIPEGSVSSDVTNEVLLTYSDDDDVGNFEARFDAYSGEYCFGLPWAYEAPNYCTVEDYSEDDLIYWPDYLLTRDFSYLNYSGAEGGSGVTGEFLLEFTRNYCSNFAPSENEDQEVKVVECLPVRNETHPFAYPYHEVTIAFDEVNNNEYYVEDEEINPFYATHSCCSDSGNLLGEEDECYESEVGCYGLAEGVAEAGYVKERAIDFCSGTRGNVCGTPDEDGGSSTLVHWLMGADNDQLVCGNSSTMPECSRLIADECAEKEAWGYTTDANGNNGWCKGTMGCTSYCSETIVYVGDDLDNFLDAYSEYGSLNEMAENGFDLQDNDLACGCEEASAGDTCMMSQGEPFGGVCQLSGTSMVCDTPAVSDSPADGVTVNGPTDGGA